MTDTTGSITGYKTFFKHPIGTVVEEIVSSLLTHGCSEVLGCGTGVDEVDDFVTSNVMWWF